MLLFLTGVSETDQIVINCKVWGVGAASSHLQRVTFFFSFFKGKSNILQLKLGPTTPLEHVDTSHVLTEDKGPGDPLLGHSSKRYPSFAIPFKLRD